MDNQKEKLIEVLSKHIPYGYGTLCLIAEELMADGVRLEEKRATDVREKLVELIFKSLCRHIHKSCKLAENIADDLIADGVTVQGDKDINVPTKWISVKDRLPEPFTSVLAYVPSEAPLPLVHESYFVDAPQVWVCIIEKRPWKQGAVTHWMPLPEPPKGE